jgi:SAM-dependent methyltransferase
MGVLGRLTGTVHHGLIFGRRVRALAEHIAAMIPKDARTVLDVGCGDGTLATLVMRQRPELEILGLEVRARPVTAIPVTEFDGQSMPLASSSHDVVMFVDVLHHAENGEALLREASRVAKDAVVIKDHIVERLFSRERLRAMDWVGNVGHGVALPYNYWTRKQWRAGFEGAGLLEVDRRERLGLYLPPMSWIFEPGLHFVSRLRPVGDKPDPSLAE